MIHSKNISVVVQGAIDKKNTKKCLQSVRKYLPNAEIILSIWENSDVSFIEKYCNKIIFNEDPGAVIFDEQKNIYNNLNRIIVSSVAGIKQSTKKYVLRIRSDLYLKNANKLNLKDDLEKRNNEMVLFQKRILAYECFSIKCDINSDSQQNMLFHISDWCHFGLKEDLEELFNIPLVKEPEFSRYYEYNRKPTFSEIFFTRLWKMSPEQYITSTNAKKIINQIDFETYLDINPKNIELSENFIINNFRIYSKKQWGIYPLKTKYKNINMRNDFLLYNFYSDYEIKLDYQKYIDKNYKIPLYYSLLKEFYSNRELSFKLHKHWKRVRNCLLVISEICSVLHYFIKIIFYIGEKHARNNKF